MDGAEHAPEGSNAEGEKSDWTVTPEQSARPGIVETPAGTLRFLNVSGDRVAMAAQLGARLKHDIHRGVVPHFAGLLEKMLRRSNAHRVAKTLSWGAHAAMTRKLRDNIPSVHREAIYALSDACQLPARVLFDAYLMPETFLWVVGTYHRVLRTPAAMGLGNPPAFGCTSAVVAPPRAEGLLHGRNFDYFGIDLWERETSIIFYHPDDALDYVSIGSAGIWGGGVTAMNAAGLTLAVHEHFLGELDRDGVPIGLAGDEVMRRAHTIEEAVAILREFPPVAGWTYVLTEGDTGRAAVFEVAPGRDALFYMREGEAALGYANTFWSPDFRDAAVDYYPEYHRTSAARQERVVQLLRGDAMQRDVGPAQVASILNDMVDPDTGAERLAGRTIANISTVASVVFEPAQRRVWVAAGRSPTSAGWFVPFDLRSGRPGTVAADVSPFCLDPEWEESARGRALSLYRQAHVRYLDGESDDRLTVLIEHALALYNREANLHIIAGLLALRTNRARRAEGAFHRALELTEEPARRAEIKLYLAWALDLLDRRKDARHLYKQVGQDARADDLTRGRARQHRWLRFQPEQAAQLPLDFIYAGVPA